MFDVPSSVVERLVYQQDELAIVFGDLRLSVDHSGSRGDIDLSHTRETGTEASADSGPRNISYTTVAGFPRTRQLGGTSFKTTEPAETTAPSPIVTPARIRLPIAIQLPVRMRMGATLSLKSSRRKSWLPVQRNDRRATQTLDSIVTCARLRIPTSSPDPDMVAYDQAPWKRDIHIAANAYSFPNLRPERSGVRQSGRPIPKDRDSERKRSAQLPITLASTGARHDRNPSYRTSRVS